MKIHIKYCLFLLLSAFVVGCDTPPEPTTSPAVESYLKNIISIMQANSINRKNIDWSVFTTNVLEKAKGIQTIDDANFNAAIVLALTQLQDSHSFFINNKGNYLLGLGRNGDCTNTTPIIPSLDKEIGYIKISAFSGSGIEANNFAETIQNTIRKADNPTIKGWIVDLRGNTGGNMWPMLVGVGPILGEGTVGYFIDPNASEFVWGYYNGVSSGVKVNSAYTLLNPNPKVAVLTDQATASSGEAITIAFRGRSNTKSFGLPTCGISTANQGFPIGDGATLLLTVSTMADRTKKMYGKSVVPDVVENNQQVYLQQAIDWLKQ